MNHLNNSTVDQEKIWHWNFLNGKAN